MKLELMIAVHNLMFFKLKKTIRLNHIQMHRHSVRGRLTLKDDERSFRIGSLRMKQTCVILTSNHKPCDMISCQRNVPCSDFHFGLDKLHELVGFLYPNKRGRIVCNSEVRQSEVRGIIISLLCTKAVEN